MATYTDNLDLKKPETSDKIRIADINNNMDAIDEAVGDIGDTDVATQLGDIRGGMAIVSTGNTHDAISAGQFVYVMGHDTLDDGLYTANSALAANATLSSSNVTAVSGGGLNALNSKIAMHSSYLSGIDSGTTVNAIKYNYDFAFITFTSANKTWAEGDSFGTLPVGAYPVGNMRTTGNMYGSNIGVQIRISTDGSVKYDSQNSVSGRISFTAMYVIAH